MKESTVEESRGVKVRRVHVGQGRSDITGGLVRLKDYVTYKLKITERRRWLYISGVVP